MKINELRKTLILLEQGKYDDAKICLGSLIESHELNTMEVKNGKYNG